MIRTLRRPRRKHSPSPQTHQRQQEAGPRPRPRSSTYSNGVAFHHTRAGCSLGCCSVWSPQWWCWRRCGQRRVDGANVLCRRNCVHVPGCGELFCFFAVARLKVRYTPGSTGDRSNKRLSLFEVHCAQRPQLSTLFLRVPLSLSLLLRRSTGPTAVPLAMPPPQLVPEIGSSAAEPAAAPFAGSGKVPPAARLVLRALTRTR